MSRAQQNDPDNKVDPGEDLEVFFGAEDDVGEMSSEDERGDTVVLGEDDLEEEPETVTEATEDTTEDEESEEEVVAEEAAEEESEEVTEDASEVTDGVEEVVEDEPVETAADETNARRSTTIPRPRFDQVNNKLKEANQRIAELVEQKAPVAVSKETEADVAFQAEMVTEQHAINDLVLDGDTEGAAAKQAALNVRMTTKVLESARAQARAEVTETFAQRAYNKTLTTVETNFPFINPDQPDSYDESMVTRVRTITQSLMASEGYEAADALQEAAETVAARFYPDMLSTEDTGDVVDTSVANKKLAATKAEQKKLTVAKKLGVAKRQPRKIGGDSTAEGKDGLPNVFDMSESEFSNLSSTELARLRGDIV